MPVTATSEPCRMCAETKKTSGLNLAQDGTAAVDTSSSAQKGFTFDAGTSHAPSTTTTHFNPSSGLSPSMKRALLKKKCSLKSGLNGLIRKLCKQLENLAKILLS